MAYNDISEGDAISAAWGNMVEDALGSGTPALPASVTIWKSGSTYYARNGLTGARTSSSDWSTLVNTNILSLYDSGSGTGGNILNLPGVYTHTATINMRPGVYVDGVGRGAGLGHCTEIDASTDVIMFDFDYPDTTVLHYGGLRNLRIDGNAVVTTKSLVEINPSREMHMADIDIHNCTIIDGYRGIYVENNTTAKALWNVDVRNCYLEECLAQGIYLNSTTNQSIKQCRFIGNHFYNNCQSAGNGGFEIDGHETRGGLIMGCTFELEQKHGIYAIDEADSWSIIGNVIIESGQAGDNTYDGLHFEDIDYFSITGNVSRNRGGAVKQRYGYNTDNSCTYCMTSGNVFGGKTGGATQGTHATMRPTQAGGDISNLNTCETA